MPVKLKLSTTFFPRSTRTIYLAYSGGLDSSVLLDLLHALTNKYQVIVWHINHGLQENADRVQSFSRAQAVKYAMEFRCNHLQLDSSASNLEQLAREQRYKIFSDALDSGSVLLTAHHASDQVETFFLNLSKGSGVDGLAAMPVSRPLGKGILMRPLLGYSREQVYEYATQRSLHWIDDPSNTDTRFDRNFLRCRVIPVIEERWPGFSQNLNQSVALIQQSKELLDELAATDLVAAGDNVVSEFKSFNCVSLVKLKTLSVARMSNAIRYWLKSSNCRPPGRKQLWTFINQFECEPDQLPELRFNGVILSVYHQHLFLREEEDLTRSFDSVYELQSDGQVEIAALEKSFNRSDVLKFVDTPDTGQSVKLYFRCQNTLNDSVVVKNRHKLKRLFQKYHTPPWVRDRVPQIVIDDELVDLYQL